MIKKSFSTLAAFLLGAVISITVVACADDLKEFVECNCNDTIKELFAKIDGFEDRIVKIEKIDYDSLAQIVFQRINTNNTINNCDCEEKWEELDKKLESLNKDILELKTSTPKSNVATFEQYWEGNKDYTASFIYDTNGRMIEARTTGQYENYSYVMTYEDNVCTVYRDGSTHRRYTLDNKQSTDFSYINLMILSDLCEF